MHDGGDRPTPEGCREGHVSSPALRQVAMEFQTINTRLCAVCAELEASTSLTDCLEWALLLRLARYAEAAQDASSHAPGLYEPFDVAITRVQHNVAMEMRRLRQLREQGIFGPSDEDMR